MSLSSYFQHFYGLMLCVEPHLKMVSRTLNRRNLTLINSPRNQEIKHPNNLPAIVVYFLLCYGAESTEHVQMCIPIQTLVQIIIFVPLKLMPAMNLLVGIIVPLNVQELQKNPLARLMPTLQMSKENAIVVL